MTMCEKRTGNYNIEDHVLVRVNVKNESLLGFFFKVSRLYDIVKIKLGSSLFKNKCIYFLSLIMFYKNYWISHLAFWKILITGFPFTVKCEIKIGNTRKVFLEINTLTGTYSGSGFIIGYLDQTNGFFKTCVCRIPWIPGTADFHWLPIRVFDDHGTCRQIWPGREGGALWKGMCKTIK